MTLHQWEQLSEDGNGGWACRMAVPGGWLYRHSTPGTVEQYQHMMVFVPAPPDPPLMVVGNAKPADVNKELVAALADLLSGWRYIRTYHGDLSGVGWDRAQQRAEAALAKAHGGQA